MKGKVIAALLLGLVLLVGCNGGGNSDGTVPSPSELAKQGFVSPELPRISAEELKVIYDNRDPLILVDVRPKDLFDTGYIPGARNIPNEPEAESLNKLTQLPKDRLIVTYCDWPDDGEAALAADRMIKAGYTNVKILWKGLFRWMEIGGETR